MVTPGWAASVRSLESLQKQAGKFAQGLSVDNVKSLCACFLPSGDVHTGFVTQFVVTPSPGIQRLALGCAVPNYVASTGEVSWRPSIGWIGPTWEMPVAGCHSNFGS